MKKLICQLYLPSFFRSYGKDALKEIKILLPELKIAGISGVYLISLWADGGADNGFDRVEYTVNPNFGTDDQLREIIREAHRLDMTVGVDIVPNHVSNQCELAQRCIKGDPVYEDVLYVVDEETAKRLTKAGVPSFFGTQAYCHFGKGKYVRTTFADYRQLNLNWESEVVKDYFRNVFRRLSDMGVDFYRIDCGMMLLEDVSKADPHNPMACMRPLESINAIMEVAGGAKLFFEWFSPDATLFECLHNAWALDCSYVMTGVQNLDWSGTSTKLVPLLGGHDQMTLKDRGILPVKALLNAFESSSDYIFLDMQSLIGWETDPIFHVEDEAYDADPKNKNMRYRVRRPIDSVIKTFRWHYCR